MYTGVVGAKLEYLLSANETALESSSLLSDVAPPDPIPNSEVKRVSANNSDTREGS